MVETLETLPLGHNLVCGDIGAPPCYIRDFKTSLLYHIFMCQNDKACQLYLKDLDTSLYYDKFISTNVHNDNDDVQRIFTLIMNKIFI